MVIYRYSSLVRSNRVWLRGSRVLLRTNNKGSRIYCTRRISTASSPPPPPVTMRTMGTIHVDILLASLPHDTSSSLPLSLETLLYGTMDPENKERIQRKVRTEDRWNSMVGMIVALAQNYSLGYPFYYKQLSRLRWCRTGFFHKPYIQYTEGTVSKDTSTPSTTDKPLSLSSSSLLSVSSATVDGESAVSVDNSIIRLPYDTNISHDGSFITCGTVYPLPLSITNTIPTNNSNSNKKNMIGIDLLRLSRIYELFGSNNDNNDDKDTTTASLPRILKHLPPKIQNIIYQNALINDTTPSSSSSSKAKRIDRTILGNEFSMYWTIMESLTKVSDTTGNNHRSKSIHDPSIQKELENMIITYSYKDGYTTTATSSNTTKDHPMYPTIQFSTVSSIPDFLRTWIKEYHQDSSSSSASESMDNEKTSTNPILTNPSDNPSSSSSLISSSSSSSSSFSSPPPPTNSSPFVPYFRPLPLSDKQLLYIHEGKDWKCWTWKITTSSLVTKVNDTGNGSPKHEEILSENFASTLGSTPTTSTTKNSTVTVNFQPTDIILSIVIQ